MSDVPDMITVQGQSPMAAYDQKYGGLSWVQRTFGDPPQSVAGAEYPIVVNGEKRYVTKETLQALQDAINEDPRPRMVINGEEVYDLDLTPDGANTGMVPTTRGRTSL